MNIGDSLYNFFDKHHNLLYLWCPVLFALGLYGGLWLPLSMVQTVLVMAVFLLGWVWLPTSIWGLSIYAIRGVLVVVAGVGWMNGWLYTVKPHTLSYGGLMVVQGKVSDVYYGPSKVSYTLTDTKMVRTPYKTPFLQDSEATTDAMVPVGKVRLSGFWQKSFAPKVGDSIMGRGFVLPAVRPTFLGGLQLSQYDALNGIMGRVSVSRKYAPSWKVVVVESDFWSNVLDTFQGMRHKVINKILAVPQSVDFQANDDSPTELQSQNQTVAKAIAIALMVGKRDFINAADKQAIQDAGLSHVMAISGMHVGLLIAIVFFTVRRGLALIPAVALRYNTKVLAVLLALPVAAVYVIISGMGIPAVRALGMASLVLIGVVAYRMVITLRLVCTIALLMMIVKPLVVMQAGFILSFSAVVGLVAYAEHYKNRLRSPVLRYQKSIKNPALSVVFAVIIYGFALTSSSLVATLATVPAVMHYFGTIPLYGVIANVLVIPVVVFWVMPMGIISMIAMIFGWQDYVLPLMFWGTDWIVTVSYWVQDLPHAVAYLTPNSAWIYGSTLVGGVWWVVWKYSLIRYGGLVVFFAGVFISILSQKPVVMIGKTGTVMAVRHMIDNQPTVTMTGWTSTLHKSYNLKTVGKVMGVNPKDINIMPCDRKKVCIIPVNSTDNSILEKDKRSQNIVIVPYQAPLYQDNAKGQKSIAYYCQNPQTILVIAPKTYTDYGDCDKPMVGRADMGEAVNIYWQQELDKSGIPSITLVKPGEIPLLQRLRKIYIPYLPTS